LTEAFATFEATVAEAARTRDWDAWVSHYTGLINALGRPFATKIDKPPGHAQFSSK